MLTGLENYYKPADLKEAFQLLADPEKKNVLIGGGSILALSNSPGIEGLVDLSLLELNKIEDQDDFLVLQACCTMRNIQKAPESQKYFSQVLQKSAGNYLTALARNQAQIAGILVGAYERADIIAALMALDASLVIYTPEGEKRYSLEEIYRSEPYSYFSQGIITQITIPKQQQEVSYHRIAKVATDTSIISVVISKRKDNCLVAAGGCTHLPVRLKKVESLLNASIDLQKIEKAIEEELKTFSDVRACAQYRLEMAKVLIRRAITELWR